VKLHSFGDKQEQENTPRFKKKEALQGGTQRACLMMFDRQLNQPSVIKVIQSPASISSIKYGPYDNGHIMVGLTNGVLLAFSSTDLTKLLQYELFQQPITSLFFDPTHCVIASSFTGEVAAVSLIENKVKYMYVDLGRK